jgi:hypothetical protein
MQIHAVQFGFFSIQKLLLISGKSPGSGRSRSDTSLGILTRRFVSLLRSAPDGVSS